MILGIPEGIKLGTYEDGTGVGTRVLGRDVGAFESVSDGYGLGSIDGETDGSTDGDDVG